MFEASRMKIPLAGRPVRSLCWQGDELVDPLEGIRYRLDGSSTSESRAMDPSYDSALISSDGSYTVLYEARGTRGAVYRGGELVRPLTRDTYYAGEYDYPVVLFRWFDGRTAIAHCPEK
jgi:hypothetical protein